MSEFRALSVEDAFDVANRVMDMAERVQVVHKIAPGSKAECTFTASDLRFRLIVMVDREPAMGSADMGNGGEG